jgi:23S rRNA (cytosine1962-C5)-methyltransferase
METLYLKRGEDRRIKRGHPWVYSNEIDVGRSPLRTLENGEPVCLRDANGRALGTGLVSPHSLICLRLMSRELRQPEDLVGERLRQALAWRERVFNDPYYRWVYGEGDGLPGLVIDRYADTCAIQTSTWGMERLLDAIIDAVDALVAPTAIVLKNDAGMRVSEGLPAYVDVRRGVGDTATVIEHGVRYEVPLSTGQKTGWFFDQRDNRCRFISLYKDARVLDLFSYVGAWGVAAAVRGARAVTCVDSSGRALDAARANASRNGVAAQFATVKSDVTTYLAGLKDEFDWVILDPPSLVPRRRDLAGAQEHYRQLNRLALARVVPGGIFVSCSCSALLDESGHLSIIRAAARKARRGLTVIGRGTMPADHPLDPMLPESGYLKCWYFCVA